MQQIEWRSVCNSIAFKVFPFGDVQLTPVACVHCRYAAALYWAITTMSSTGFGDILPMTNWERSYSLCVMLVGVILSALVFGVLAQIITEAFDDLPTGTQHQSEVWHSPEHLLRCSIGSSRNSYPQHVNCLLPFHVAPHAEVGYTSACEVSCAYVDILDTCKVLARGLVTLSLLLYHVEWTVTAAYLHRCAAPAGACLCSQREAFAAAENVGTGVGEEQAAGFYCRHEAGRPACAAPPRGPPAALPPAWRRVFVAAAQHLGGVPQHSRGCPHVCIWASPTGVLC